MSTILQMFVSGISMGFIYALVAIEYTLIWNATNLLNFSHDKFITLGAYIYAGSLILGLGLPIPMGILLAAVIMFGFGAFVATIIFNPMRNMSSGIFTIMCTVMLGKIISEVIRLAWGPIPFTLQNYLSGSLKLAGAVLPKANLYIIAVSVLIVVVLQVFFNFTKAGKAMRCVSQNKEAAELMGINVTASIRLTVGISAVICSVIAMLVIPLFNIDVGMSSMVGLKGFASGVVGGFGYFPGTIVGGMIIGIMENLSILVLPAVYKDVVAFVLMILFLLVRPGGLLRPKY